MTLDLVLEAHSAQREMLITRVTEILNAQWAGLNSWNRADVDRFVAIAGPLVTGAQNSMARLVDVYVAEMLSEMLGKRINPEGITTLRNLRGPAPEEVYRRPFVEHWTNLSKGMAFAESIVSAGNRVTELADDDLNLAYRHATVLAFRRKPVKGYRRVVRPELSRGGTCDLCRLASQNVYKRESLMPIHTRCRCAVLAIGATDPGLDMNTQDLSGLPETTEVPVVRNHGELGPLLMVKGQSFTSESALAA